MAIQGDSRWIVRIAVKTATLCFARDCRVPTPRFGSWYSETYPPLMVGRKAWWCLEFSEDRRSPTPELLQVFNVTSEVGAFSAGETRQYIKDKEA